MTRQLPKPVAATLGWVIFGTINAAIYSGGWALMRIDDLCAARRRAWTLLLNEYQARRVGAHTEKWLKDGAR
ncbi:hypothetical protein [Mycobacterium sp. 48b]|uniref:hypothetical protein n=1 Tax=Mycobacterium sp. 48b TaxID=3400426 RepID=UPI003AAAEB50